MFLTKFLKEEKECPREEKKAQVKLLWLEKEKGKKCRKCWSKYKSRSKGNNKCFNCNREWHYVRNYTKH